MSLTRTWFIGILLLGVGLGAMCSNAGAQSWQAARPADGGGASRQAARPVDDAVTPVDWEQRTLRRPLNWQGPTTQPSASSDPAEQASSSAVDQASSLGSRRYGQDARATTPGRTYRTARRSYYDQGPSGTASMPQEPTTPMQPRARSAGNDHPPVGARPEMIPPGTQFEALTPDGQFAGEGFQGHGGPAACGGQGGELAGECDDGGPCDGPACEARCDDWPLFDGNCGPWLRGLSVFAGADGFKGPLDRGTNGNFGLNEGLNLARPLGDPWGCGYQLGVNFVQTDFSGAPTVTADDLSLRAPFRKQYFATAGIFRRAECSGFQWGVAYDYLHDIYYQNADLQQIRSETGYVIDDCWEIGYYGAYGVGTDGFIEGRNIDGKLDPTDMFLLYVRRSFENGGNGRLWAGVTGNGDGLLGADLWVPLGNSFALENRINYLIPKGTRDVAQPRESWGLVIQLVWYPGQNAMCQRQNPYRPIFGVADNSLFMVDRLAH